VITALALTAFADVWRLIAYLHRATIADDISHGNVSLATATHADDQVQLASVVELAVIILTAVLFVVWFHRIVKVIADKRPGSQRYSPGWAIGGWFVPILSLFRPKQMVDDAWRAGHDGSGPATVPSWVHLWWAAWLGSNLLGIFGRAGVGSSDPATLATHDRFEAAVVLVHIVAAGLAIAVVRGLTRRTQQMPAVMPNAGMVTPLRFNPAPGWPPPPPGWVPPIGWKPDPSWPAAPANWRFWVAPDEPALERAP
jgi:hypothetical protein